MRAIILVVLILCSFSSLKAQTCLCDSRLSEENVRGAAIGAIFSEKGDSAVYYSDCLVECFPKKHESFFVRANAYAQLYFDEIKACNNSALTCGPAQRAKQHALDNVGDADSLYRLTHPNDPHYVTMRAYKYEEFGQLDTAKQIFIQSLAEQSSQPSVYYHLIELAKSENDSLGINRYYTQLIDLRQDTTDVLNFIDHILGSITLAGKDSILAKADSLWNAFGEEFGGIYTFRYKKLKIRALQESFAEAAAMCQPLIADYPAIANEDFHLPTKDALYFLCAEVNLAADQTAQALNFFDAAFQLTAGSPASVVYVDRLSTILGQHPDFYYERYLYQKQLVNVGRAEPELKESEMFRYHENSVRSFETNVGLIKRMVEGSQEIDWDSVGVLYASIGDFQNARIAFLNLARIKNSSEVTLRLAKVEFYLKDYNESLFYLDKVKNGLSPNLLKEKAILEIMNYHYLSETDDGFCSKFADSVKSLPVLTDDENDKICQLLSDAPCGVDAQFCR